jgi:hypothetical protein
MQTTGFPRRLGESTHPGRELLERQVPRRVAFRSVRFGLGVVRARSHRLVLDALLALAPATSCFAHLLSALHGRLHVVAPSLELTEDAFRGHLALEMLDRALDAFVADDDLERLTLNGFAGVRQGAFLCQTLPAISSGIGHLTPHTGDFAGNFGGA